MMAAVTVGAVAQLGERDIRIVEVRGSTPLGSTTFRYPSTRPAANNIAHYPQLVYYLHNT